MSGRDEMMRVPRGVKLTYDDFVLFPDDGKRHELIDGEHYAPNLVVEIASPGTRGRDETLKRKLYERFGVEEYWVIEPDAETIVVYRRDGESYRHTSELAAERGDTLTTPLLPGLQAPLHRIFKD
jgi:Uma2 family endonuclease